MKPNTDQWQRIHQLFGEVVELPPNERTAFLQQACADDEVRHELEALLIANDEAIEDTGFLNTPALEVAAQAIAEEKIMSTIGTEISHYKILSLLGRGGMGEVYLAEDFSLGRQVALKLLPAEFTRDPERVQRFRQEARAASALNHPNIITIFAIDEADGTQFIATEFIDGVTLRERLNEVGMSVPEARVYCATLDVREWDARGRNLRTALQQLPCQCHHRTPRLALKPRMKCLPSR